MRRVVTVLKVLGGLYAPHASLIMTHREAYRCNTRYGTHPGRHIRGYGAYTTYKHPQGGMYTRVVYLS